MMSAGNEREFIDFLQNKERKGGKMIRDLDQVVATILEGYVRVEAEIAICGRKFMVVAWWEDDVLRMTLQYIKKED